MKKVWIVTGASKGLGLVLVQKLLFNGYQVMATSRNLEALKDAVDSDSADFLPMQMDLLNENSVSK